MRREKTINLDNDRAITVREIKISQVVKILTEKETDWQDKIEILLPMTTKDITSEEFLDLYPSEQALLWETFQEVNSAFFDRVQTYGLDKQLQKAIALTADEFLKNYVGLLKQGIAEQGNMDTVIS